MESHLPAPRTRTGANDRRKVVWAFRYLERKYGEMVRRLGFTSVPEAAGARN